MDETADLDIESDYTVVSVRFVTYPDAEPLMTTDLRVNGDVSIEDARRFVWPDGQEFPYYSDIKGRVDEFNWGASTSVAEWVVQVSAEMPFDVLVGVMSTYIVESARKGRVKPMPANETSATARALQTVLSKNADLRRDSLEVVAYDDDRATGTETVVITSDAWEFTVALRALPLNHSVIRYTRTKRN